MEMGSSFSYVILFFVPFLIGGLAYYVYRVKTAPIDWRVEIQEAAKRHAGDFYYLGPCVQYLGEGGVRAGVLEILRDRIRFEPVSREAGFDIPYPDIQGASFQLAPPDGTGPQDPERTIRILRIQLKETWIDFGVAPATERDLRIAFYSTPIP